MQARCTELQAGVARGYRLLELWSSLTVGSGPLSHWPSTPSRSYHIWWSLPLDSMARTW